MNTESKHKAGCNCIECREKANEPISPREQVEDGDEPVSPSEQGTR